MGFFTCALFVLVLILSFKSSSILEIIEDFYLFVESHFERARDFVKTDDFTQVSPVCELKCSESSPKSLVRNSLRLQAFVHRLLLCSLSAMHVE